MKSFKTSLFAISAILATSGYAPLEARRGEDQDAVRQGCQQGNVKCLREIEARVLPKMRGMEYLGPEYDSTAKVYRLKFIDKGRVIFVDVDARSGQVLRQR
jgi:uncharacterized membrane protein YkoI